MNFLVIDGAQDKVNFFSNFNNNSYHKTIKASKDNNEKLNLIAKMPKILESLGGKKTQISKFLR